MALVLLFLVLIDVCETLNYHPYFVIFMESDYPTLDDYLRFLNGLLFSFFIPLASVALILLPILLVGRYFCLRRRADLILDYLYRIFA